MPYREIATTGSKAFTLLNGRLLLYNGKLAVPSADYLRTKVIKEVHSRITTTYPGRNKTRKLVAAKY